MGLRINQNIAAQNAYRSLSVSDNQMSKSLEKLSSGFRINRAADDAAGLAISEGLRSQVGGLKVAVRNAQDGVSVVQTAEGALTEVHSVLQRMRDLAVQASNDTNNTEARANIATEVTSLTAELTRIADSTNFNGKQLLNSNTAMQFQVGADNGTSSQISVNLSAANVDTVVANLGAGGSKFNVLTPSSVTGAQGFSNGAGVTASVNLTGTYNTVDDVATALNSNAGFASGFNATVNQNNQLVVASKTGGTVVGTGAAGIGGTGVSASQGAAAGLDFSSASTATAAISLIDTAIKNVSTGRAQLGAYQNRFEHAIANTNVAIENLSASESRIRDTDMAQEMMSYTRSQILTQAGTAMLAQANQSQQGVLSLLR